MHWDFVLTSFEPIAAVTGGIGTYVRSLIEEINIVSDKSPVRILFLTPHVVDPDWTARLRSDLLHTVLIDYNKKFGGSDLNYVGDEHAYFSFKVAEYLETLSLSGDSFGLMEFSDYGRDGYYTIKKKRLGFIGSGITAIRLHSPDIMLLHDNRRSITDLDVATRYKIQQELYCYKYCDQVFFGGDEMLRRVESELSPFAFSIMGKAIKVPHPFRDFNRETRAVISGQTNDILPDEIIRLLSDQSAIKVVYTGRIERRKGVAEFVSAIIGNQTICSLMQKKNIQFIFCGKDTHSGVNGKSLINQIRDEIRKNAISNNVHFVGHVSQTNLYEHILPSADAFVFPSLFENYPNALIESLPYGRPTLISSRGCMQEISQGFDFVSSYDPFEPHSAEKVLNFIQSLQSKSMPPATNLSQQAKDGLLSRFLPSARTVPLSRVNPASTDELHVEPITPNEKNIAAKSKYDQISATHNGFLRNKYLELISQKSIVSELSSESYSVSFVIPHYNNANYVESCLRSVTKCAEKFDQVIVVDDCSAPDQLSIVERLCEKYGARLIKQEINQGPSAARNAGVLAASSELIQFIDADDILDEGGFRRSRLVLERVQEIDFVYGITHTFGETDHMWMPRDASINAFEENYAHSAILCRREQIEAIGLFDEELRFHYEDWEINCRFALLGKIGEAIPYVTLHYRQKPGSRNISNEDKITNSRLLVVERSVVNSVKRLRADRRLSDAVVNLGVYMTSWLRADLWIQERERYFEVLKQDNAAIRDRAGGALTQVRLGNDFVVEPFGGRYESGSHFIVKHHILSKYYGQQLGDRIRKTNLKVSRMSRKERVRVINHSKLFDRNWYLENNPDVSAEGLDPGLHYEVHGWVEGRSPSPFIAVADIKSILEDGLPNGESPISFAVFAMMLE